MSSGDAVQQIKDRLSIVDVVAPYVELHQAGKNMKGKSPFTNEKTPSFFVSPDRGMYYCFSTNQGGDMFTFVQAMEGVDFKGALTILAEKAGVELKPEDPAKRSERETGLAVLAAAAKFYTETLHNSPAATAYVHDRGVTNETLRKWQIGYAPGPPTGGWRELRTHLTQQKFGDDVLTRVGLIKGAVDGKEPYDVFRDRIMFPIFDQSGHVVAFSGRILSKDSDAPKYVNSPETAFFNKSEVLYGYDKAKQGIRHYDFSLIVEGQFDVVMSHQAGYTNTVAVSGTALTAYHVGLLQRLSNRVVLALDADKAGIAAVKRAADLMLARGMDVKVAQIIGGKDPADLVREDPKLLKHAVGQAVHVIEFLLNVLANDVTDERQYKLRAREEILPYVASIDNEIDAEHFERIVADRIGSTTAAVHAEVNRLRERSQQRSAESAATANVSAETTERPASQFQSRAVGLREYLLVAAELLEPNDQAKLTSALAHLSAQSGVLSEAVPAERKSGLLFTIEAHFADKKNIFIYEEINEKFNELQRLIIRGQLQAAKEALYEAERLENDSAIAAEVERVDRLQKELAAISVIQDIFAADDVAI